MPQIPVGEYYHPLGKLRVRKDDNYSCIIEFWPDDDHVAKKGVDILTWFWVGDNFDGHETAGGMEESMVRRFPPAMFDRESNHCRCHCSS